MGPKKDDCGPLSIQFLFEPREKFLCTGASFYAPYSLLLISYKFWKASRRGRSKGAELEGENKRGGGVEGMEW